MKKLDGDYRLRALQINANVSALALRIPRSIWLQNDVLLRKASVETLTHISDTLNIPLDFMVRGETGEQYRVFLNPHKRLTDRQKRAFQEIIDMLCVLIEEWTLK